MDKSGKSGGTISSYTMELRLAQEELGEDTLLTDLRDEYSTKRELAHMCARSASAPASRGTTQGA